MSARAAKKAVNVSIAVDLLAAARAHGINLSAALESAVARELRERRRADWLSGNAESMAAYNRDVEEHGAFGGSPRSF